MTVNQQESPNPQRRLERLINRPRRNRKSPGLRAMIRETRLSPEDFVYPLFVHHGEGIRREIPSMPGQYQFSIDQLEKEVDQVVGLGIPAVMLFGIPAEKDPAGRGSYQPQGIIQQAVREIKDLHPDLVVITDVCLCEYTDHGHCGILQDGVSQGPGGLPEGYVLNEPTLEVLGKTALSQARAGADLVAPSGMMDGMVRAIRSALDQGDFQHVGIMSYAVKYASAFYGPFRDAAESPPQFGDRKSHQMDPANAREALREARLDLEEGADFLMVKPGLPYLDIIYRVSQAFPELPLAAYNVSGEYAVLKAAASRGWVDEQTIILETLTSLKRAGADLIITYHAKEAAGWLASRR
jgi:porphobilinogen synthase